MGNISLAEAVKLKSILTKRIYELEDEVNRVSFAIIEKGDIPKIGLRNTDTVIEELDEVRADYRTLIKLMYRANIDNTVTFKDEQLTIVEAIELATQLRAKAALYKGFGSSEEEEIQYGVTDSTTVYRVALFDPEEYRQKAIEIEKQAHKLSNAINAKNYSVTIEFDDEKYF